MAKQSGYIKLEGTIGDLSFYKNRNGNFVARRKGGVSKKRLLTDPKFQRTRENMQEFARAATAGKFLKNAFREIEIKSNGGRLHNRLYSISMKVVKSDLVSARGDRKFELGDMTLLKGFEFAENSVLGQVVKKQLIVLDEPASFSVTVPELVPSKYLISPKGSTHYRFSLIRAAINFEVGAYNTEIVTVPPMQINSATTPELTLTLPKPGIAGEKYFFAFAVEFLEMVNGNQYDLYDLSQNPAVILSVV